jgi:hypothetical protein
MPQVDERLLTLNKQIQNDLWTASKRYLDAGDVRWMFAFAHFRITQQLNEAMVQKPPHPSCGALGDRMHPVCMPTSEHACASC